VRERLAGHVRIALGAVVVLLLGGGVLALFAGGSGRGAISAVRSVAGGGGGQQVDLDPTAIAKERGKVRTSPSGSADGSRPQVVVAVPPGSASEPDQQPSPSSGSHAPTDAQIKRDLEQFKQYLATIPPTTGKRAAVISTGEAAAPFDAPQTVIDVVQAANQIALTPYKWGGGHGAWRDKGYDCSGSVSFALAAAGLLDRPLDSTSFESYGAAGPGRWITIYANASHAFMTVAGLRFDTGGLSTGTRWQSTMRPTNGFVVRHPPGL
jgi:cell wall-associated NlpC family hydrolase